MDHTTIFRDDSDFKLIEPDVTWRLAEHDSAVADALFSSDPSLHAICDRLQTSLPIQRQWAFGDAGVFVRPDRHARAIYADLARVTDSKSPGSIAIKGAEAICENFGQMIERLTNMWNINTWLLGGPGRQMLRDHAMLSALERFPVVEGKPPGVHPHWDALEEAECALEIQSAHLSHFGELARAPVPLLVSRFPDTVGETILGALEPHLSPKGAREVKAQIVDGLGVYVYYYPNGVPLRVMHIQAPDATNGKTLSERRGVLESVCNPEESMQRWIEIVTRMLILGYVSTDPANFGRGYCVHPQNMVIDGGLVDLNSLRKIDTFTVESEFRFSLMRTFQVLAQSFSWFLSGTAAGTDNYQFLLPDAYSLVSTEIKSRLVKAMEGGAVLNPWLTNAIRSRGLFGDLSGAVDHLVGLGDYRPSERELISSKKHGHPSLY